MNSLLLLVLLGAGILLVVGLCIAGVVLAITLTRKGRAGKNAGS
jgi:hypothetical protein